MLSGMRGKGGGYRLTRNPSDYSAGEILRLTEGSLAPVSCLDGTCSGCERAADCPTVGCISAASMITGYLDSVTIEELRCSPRGIDYVI